MMKRALVGLGLVVTKLSLAATMSSNVAQTQINIDQALPAIEANAPGLNPNVAKLALEAYNCAVLSGQPARPTLSVIDFSLPSSQKRMWVIDLQTNKVLFNNLVAHGKGSGNAMANTFSNQSSSHTSSLGLYRTEDTYFGHNGYSLKLVGLDKGFNDQALSRSIVVHGAAYVNESIVQQTGRIGRSWGCPAVPTNLAQPIINTIKGGSLMFAYYPEQSWLQQSKYLHCSGNLLANNAANSNTKV